MSEPLHPHQNKLLACLPDAELQRWRSKLEPVDLPRGKVLYESGEKLQFVFFPTRGVVSLLLVLNDGAAAEIAEVGCEGVVGTEIFMGGGSTLNRAVVQSAGFGYRLNAGEINQDFWRSNAVRHLLLRYTQAQMTQITQNAACNRHHTLDQQLSRWLLISLDRLPSNRLVMTQELIANMLGVRREGVTEAAGKLQSDDIIQYVRGRITVLDRPMLEQRACECYEAVKMEYARLFPTRTGS